MIQELNINGIPLDKNWVATSITHYWDQTKNIYEIEQGKTEKISNWPSKYLNVWDRFAGRSPFSLDFDIA